MLNLFALLLWAASPDGAPPVDYIVIGPITAVPPQLTLTQVRFP